MSKRINPIENFLIRYHVVILVVIGCIALGASIASTYLAYADATGPEAERSTSSEVPTSFDTQTIERIDELYTSDQQDINVSTPPGRINPFSE